MNIYNISNNNNNDDDDNTNSIINNSSSNMNMNMNRYNTCRKASSRLTIIYILYIKM